MPGPRFAARLRARERAASERLRVPAPLVRTRLPSGRGATEQPNASGDGDAPLTARFWAAVVVTGVVTGLFGIAMMELLAGVEYLGYGYHSSTTFQHVVEAASGPHRVAALAIAGVIGGPAWYLLRRATRGERTDVDDVVWTGRGRVSLRRCLGSGIISEIVIGLGASIGREQAPRILGGASASTIADRLGLSDGQRRVLVACGSGAGLASVYNVPLGGAFYTAEIMLGSMSLPTILPALACSAVATGTAWIALPDHATYLGIPSYGFSGSIMACSLLLGPVVGVLASGYVRLIGLVSALEVTGKAALVTPLGAFLALGAVGLAYPQLFGNGKDMADDAFLGHGTLVLFLALFLLKPVVTALCLGSGASGGLFTPTLSTGAVLGGFAGLAWGHLWPGTPVGAFALVGAAAAIGSAMQAPLAGLALVLELTHSGLGLMVPMLAATVLATLVTRWIDGYSIYTARLARHPEGAGSGTASEPAGGGPGWAADAS